MRVDRTHVFTAIFVCFMVAASATLAHAASFTVGGTVSGLNTGTSVTLLDNATDSLTVSANGTFTFKTAVATGSPYSVTVKTQPTGETCTVTGGTGTVGTTNVTTVKVACKYTIGGTVSGLNTGTSVTLLDNGTDSLTVAANGTFTFKTALVTGAAYKVTISTQPTGETCTVTGGTGTVGAKNVTTVKVACKYTIGGTVSGLNTGTSVTLLDNGGDSLTVAANGTFTFKTALVTGAAYKVTISTQPTGETCTVTGGTGTVGTTNVTSVKVACKYTIGGTVSGLNTGTSVTLLDNGTDSLTVAANGTFTFKTALATGAAYKVTISTQPTGETCTVTGGTGTVGTTNVTTVKVACKYTIGGTVSGLNTGTSVTLLDNGGDSLTVAANGAFTFKTALATGAAYKVTISTQPTGETCTVTGGTGTVGTANVTTVKVVCASSTKYTIGGTVSGLNTGTSVTLLDNGGDSLTVTANGTFTFKTALASGASYSVTVGTQPTGESCTVTNGSGKVATANVTNVAVACATAKTYTIGGTVSGLNSGTSVTLLDNGGDSLMVVANGAFTFKTALASGASYSVTVGTEPTGETCTVANGSGKVGTANVTNVSVACSTNSGGGGAYWIPYSATPNGGTPAGKTGLFIIPSDKLTSAPAPTFVTTDTNQSLGVGTQITESGGVLSYSPQVLMYSDTNSLGVTKIFGLTLAGTSTVPTPVQISSLSLPSTQEICQNSSAETDVTKATTLFLVLEVGTPTQCSSGAGTFEVVHYTDSSSTAPVVVSITSTNLHPMYSNGKLDGMYLYVASTTSVDLYTDDTFTSPVQKITGVTGFQRAADVLNAATLSTAEVFFEVTTTTNANELYRADGGTLAVTLIQNMAAGTIHYTAQDDTNLYYDVSTPGASNTTVDTFNQVALTGGTPKTLYTTPAYVGVSSTAEQDYRLIGSNDSVVAFSYDNFPLTSGSRDLTKATSTVYDVPVGTTTTTPKTLATYTAGNSLATQAFVAAPSGSGYSGNIVFGTLLHATGTASSPTITLEAVSVPMNGGTPPAPIANSAYEPLAIISSQLGDSVWQITGITDTNGAFGGGTANIVTVSNLTDTPLTTTGGGDYKFSTGFIGALFSISSNNIALGVLSNAGTVSQGQIPQEDGAAVDLTKKFLYPIIITNTLVQPY